MRQPEGVSPRGAASRASRALGFAWLAACKTLASKHPKRRIGSILIKRANLRLLQQRTAKP